MIFVDANVFMYAAGREHPHKAPSARLLRAIAKEEVEATTSAEVLQEILHRYRAIGRWEQGRNVYRGAKILVDAVLPVTGDDVDTACKILDAHPQISARDALHVAVARRAGISRICSYDTGFDGLDGIARSTPDEVVPARPSHAR